MLPRDPSPPGLAEDLLRRRAHWDERAASCPTDEERIDSTERSQRARFSTLDPLLFPGCSLLDVGCGVGDLSAYLAGKGDKPGYRGVDLAPRMVARAKEKHPAARFEEANILDWDPAPLFDLVVGISIHSDLVTRPAQLLQQVLARQFSLCRVAAHVSLLSSHYPHRPGVQAWSPAWVLSVAREITPWVSLRHDYLPHDFAVTLHREAAPCR